MLTVDKFQAPSSRMREEQEAFRLMRKKISTTIYVTLEQADKLKLLHERTKVPVSVYIREGIDLVLRHYAHLLPGQLTLVDAEPQSASPTPPDVSEDRTTLTSTDAPPPVAAAGAQK